MYRSILSAGVILVLLSGAAQAAPFQNLDFEHVTIQFTEPPWRSEVLLNGWDTGPALLAYDAYPLGSTAVVVHDEHPLQGRYTIFMHTGYTYQPLPDDLYLHTHAFVSQVGDVPRGARLLLFDTDSPLTNPLDEGWRDLVVTLNENVIPLFEVPARGIGRTYAGDVSGFAGQTAALRFELFDSPLYTPVDHVALDWITFEPIPEPSSLSVWALLGALGIGLGWWRRRRKA